MRLLLALILALQPGFHLPQQARIPGPGGTTAAGGGGGTFTLTQAVADRATWANHLTCAGTGCTLAVPSTGTGHGFLAFAYDGSGNKLTTVTGGGTWTVPAASCVAASGPVGGTSCAYVTNSTSGTTSLSFTFNGTVGDVTIAYWEYAWSGASISFDNCWSTNPGTTATTLTGPTLSLAGGTEVVGTLASASGSSITAVAAPYNTNFVNQDDATGALSPNAGSTVLNTPTNTASSWTITPAQFFIINACALKGN